MWDSVCAVSAAVPGVWAERRGGYGGCPVRVKMFCHQTFELIICGNILERRGVWPYT